MDRRQKRKAVEGGWVCERARKREMERDREGEIVKGFGGVGKNKRKGRRKVTGGQKGKIVGTR